MAMAVTSRFGSLSLRLGSPFARALPALARGAPLVHRTPKAVPEGLWRRHLCVRSAPGGSESKGTAESPAAGATSRAESSTPRDASASEASTNTSGGPQGPAAAGRDVWLPHDLLPIGSPVFYLALVIVPVLVWHNEKTDGELRNENERLKEERMRRKASAAAASAVPADAPAALRTGA
eukprot:TRINITY_DN35057_c0_g1_i1.p1 TRINITY_DN35057_c0_g1~~TRINITY_DN35057_c0_g1_i1.p1  ORF type:complete len:179 (+),score=38.14 TRINITY_DN35057_c0_g1_i1:51-587(+)